MPSTALNEFPDEIFSKIFSFVPSNESLRHIAQSSRKFNALATGYLYEHVDLADGDGYISGNIYLHLRPLVTLLLARPDLARLVRRLSLNLELSDGFDSRGKEEAGEPIEDMVEVSDGLKQAVKDAAISPDEEQEWLKHLSWKDHDEALVAVLLRHCHGSRPWNSCLAAAGTLSAFSSA